MWGHRLVVSAVLLAFLVVPTNADISGSWDLTLDILPAPAFQQSTLRLTHPFAEVWESKLILSLQGTSLANLSLGLKGRVSHVYTVGELNFDAMLPAYRSASITSTFTWYGITLTLGATHWPPRYAPSRPCLLADSSYLEYRVQLYNGTLSVSTRFEDCGGGAMWRDTRVTLRDLSLCCDITTRAELLVSKEKGFEKISFFLKNLTLCPGCQGLDPRFDIQASFTTTEKSVSLYPRLSFPRDLCFTLYGSLDAEGTSFKGVELTGFRIRCALNDCQEVELKTAFTPGTLGFASGEFEYIKINTCLPPCCEEEGKLEFTTYFGESSGVLGLSRLVMKGTLPLDPFQVEVELELPTSDELKLVVRLKTEF